MGINMQDIANIKIALKYVICDMNSDLFKSIFIETLNKFEKYEGE